MTIALVIYLVLLILIAARSARSVKDIPDFFVARKKASAKAVAGSLVATILGGSAVIGAVDSGAKLGGAASWFMLVGALGLLALIPFAGKACALAKYTLPDLVEKLYGKGPRLVASLVIPIAWTGIVAAQIIAAAKLLMTFTPMSYTTAAIVSAIVFTGYTLAGGQQSILKTDFLQACLIILGLVLLAGFAFADCGAVNLGGTPSAPAFPFNTNFTPFDPGGVHHRVPRGIRCRPRERPGRTHHGHRRQGVSPATYPAVRACFAERGTEQRRHDTSQQFHHHMRALPRE